MQSAQGGNMTTSQKSITVTNSSEIEPVTYDWGAVKWVANDKLIGNCAQSVGFVFVLPGKTNPEHHHTACEEIVYMLSGVCDVQVGDQTARLTAGQTLHIPRGVKHIVHNRGWEPVTYIASFSASSRGTVFADPRASQKPEDFMY
jgi:quercetin dioxygenase-like cupin family protein